jgi:hypothetical protein
MLQTKGAAIHIAAPCFSTSQRQGRKDGQPSPSRRTLSRAFAGSATGNKHHRAFMLNDNHTACRYFVTYSGVKLPLNLINPLADADLQNRITYFRGYYDEQNRLVTCEKIVYGEIEFVHRYEYHADGAIKRAEIVEPDEEPRVMCFDAAGNPAAP